MEQPRANANARATMPQLVTSTVPQLMYSNSPAPSEYSLVSNSSSIQPLNRLDQDM